MIDGGTAGEEEQIARLEEPTGQAAGLARLGLLSPLRRGQFALLFTGQTVSRLGDAAYGTVLTWTVYATSGSAAATGAVLTAFAVPQLILVLAGGVVGDRVSRRTVILVSDVISGLSISTIAILAATGHLTVPALAVLSAIFGTVSAFFRPAYSALVPDVAPPDALQAANSLQMLTVSGAQIVGPSLGAFLYTLGRAAAALGFDAATFVVAALASWFLRVSRAPPASQGSVWQDVRAGWNYVRSTSWIWITLAIASVVNAVAGSSLVILLPAVIRGMHLGVVYMGLTFTISGVVSVIGLAIMAQVPGIRHRGLVMYGGWSFLAIAVLAVGLAPTYPVVALGGAFFGLGVIGEPIWASLVQERVPRSYLSRVFSMDMLGSFALRPLGLAGVGIVASIASPRAVLIIGGTLSLALFLLGAMTPAIRHLD